jgi:hypothetical protein
VRQEFPHWTFGVIDIDPNAPHLTILPNEWTFHEFAPWVRRKTNGKDGEWVLQKNFRREFPKEFIDKVKDWYLNLRPGSLLAIAVCLLLVYILYTRKLTFYTSNSI